MSGPYPVPPTWEAGRFAVYRDRFGGIAIHADGEALAYFQPGDEASALETDITLATHGDRADLAALLENYV